MWHKKCESNSKASELKDSSVPENFKHILPRKFLICVGSCASINFTDNKDWLRGRYNAGILLKRVISLKCLIQTADVIVVAGRFWNQRKPLSYSCGSFTHKNTPFWSRSKRASICLGSWTGYWYTALAMPAAKHSKGANQLYSQCWKFKLCSPLMWGHQDAWPQSQSDCW